MTSLQAALLGLLQGLTEFLPVSSSGHLLLAETLLQVQTQGGVLFDVLVHAGTLLAIVVVFRRDLGELLRSLAGLGRRPGRPADRLLVNLFIGSLPALAVVLLLELIPCGDHDLMRAVEGTLRSPSAAPLFTGACLLVTAALLACTLRARSADVQIGLGIALAIGAMQALALLPGVSRSGATIATALVLGVARPEAARFSFLLAIPAIGGAAAYEGLKLLGGGSAGGDPVIYLVGFLVSFLVGLASLVLLLRMVRRGQLAWFAPYCALLGLAAITWWLLRG
jgi:undecaprenyl-diphosphatase